MENYLVNIIDKNPLLKYIFAFGFGIVVAEYVLAFFDIRPKNVDQLSEEINRLEVSDQINLVNLININIETRKQIDKIGENL